MSTSHVQYRLKTYPFLKSFAPQTVGTQWTGLIDFGPCTNRFLILQFFHTLPLDEIKDVEYTKYCILAISFYCMLCIIAS